MEYMIKDAVDKGLISIEKGECNMGYNSGGSAVEPAGTSLKGDTLKMLCQTKPLDIDSQIFWDTYA